jgi:rhamnogalacturonan endolyase
MNVTLKVDGLKCTMSNGLLSIIWKEDASVESIVKNGRELVKDLSGTARDSNAKRTFYIDYHAEGRFHKFHVSRLEVIEDTQDTAHIVYVDTTGLLYLEYHILMKRNISGIYTYIVCANNTDSHFSLSEFRTVYRFGNQIFDHGCNAERSGLQPTHKYMEQFECLQDETYRLPDGERYTNGEVYQKYDYAGYFSENPAWGQYGHGFGFFVIPVSTDYYPSGPLKQELLVHYDGIVLNYFTGAHFGTGNLTVPKNFKKFYGPFLVYINSDKEDSSLYADALKKAEEEQKKWPYPWVSHELYPLLRSTVKGTLTFSDGSPCRHTTVVLAKNEICFERQSDSYIYHTTTDSMGNFIMKNVRFDTYTLYAYHTGGSVTEELSLDNVIIKEKETDLQNINYPVPNRKIIWQLGTATRTSEGFVYGGELRNYKWLTLVPSEVSFTIGRDKEEETWYYAQTKPGTFSIHFTLEEVTQKPYYLIVALSGICKGVMTDKSEPHFKLRLNGTIIKEATLLNDSSVYRSATKNGRYRRLEIPHLNQFLRKGTNTLEILNENAMIMYDTLLLTQDED